MIDNSHNMKTIDFLLVWILLFFPAILFGQVNPLNVGDKVPNVYLHDIINYEYDDGYLHDFIGKPLIIDFWFRECGSCIKAMPSLDSLRREYNGKLNIIQSTYQDRDKIDNFFDTHHVGKKHKFINVVSDTILRQMFPAASFPHVVWIDGSGTVMAITDGNVVNRKNVEKFITGIPLNMNIKQDEMDPNVRYGRDPLITYFDNEKESILQYSFLSKYKPEFTGGLSIRVDSANNLTRVLYRNSDFLKLYDIAYSPPRGSDGLHRSTRLLRQDSSPIKSEADYSAFTNIFNYDLMFQGTNFRRQSEIMISDLDRYFEVESREEKRKMECYVISESDDSRMYRNQLNEEEPFFENKELIVGTKTRVNKIFFRAIEDSFNHYAHMPVLLDLESNSNKTNRISFEFTWHPDNIALMNKELSSYGLQIQIEEREFDVIVLNDRK